MFLTKLTLIGAAKIAAAIAGGPDVDITEMAVGDGGGAAVVVSDARTDLVNEVYRAPLNTLSGVAGEPTQIVADMVILAAAGGWPGREFGMLISAGDLIAYGSFPETYKPVAAEGAAKELAIRAYVDVGTTEAITILVDPTTVLATRAYVDAEVRRVGRPGIYFIAQS